MKKRSVLYAFTLILLLAFTACGPKQYVGTWYNVDDPDESIIITEDDTYLWNSVGGNVSEYEGGIILSETEEFPETYQLEYSTFDGETSLITEQGYTFIMDYEKAVDYHEEQVKQKLEELKNQVVGTWISPTETDSLEMRSDGTYELTNLLKGGTQAGSWEVYEDGKYLVLSVTLDVNTYGNNFMGEPITEPLIQGAAITDSPYENSDYMMLVGDTHLDKVRE